MTYMGACDSSTCDKFNGSTAKWLKIDQMGKSRTGTLQCVSFSSLLQSHTLSTRVNTTHSQRQTRLCDTPDPSSPRGPSSPSQDHRPPPSCGTRWSRVLPMLHANPRRWVPKRHPQPNRLLPKRIQWQRLRHLRSEHILSRSAIHFPRWTRVEPRLARGYDWPAV
jgi:hypothetical protein